MGKNNDTCCFCNANISLGESHHEECTFIRAQKVASRSTYECVSCGQDVVDLTDHYYLTFIGEDFKGNEIKQDYISDNGAVIHFLNEGTAGVIGVTELRKECNQQFNKFIVRKIERTND